MLKIGVLFRLLSAIVLASLVLAACGSASTPTPVVQESAAVEVPPATEAPSAPEVPTDAPAATPDLSGGALSIGIGVEPETLDPGDAVYVQEQFILDRKSVV